MAGSDRTAVGNGRPARHGGGIGTACGRSAGAVARGRTSRRRDHCRASPHWSHGDGGARAQREDRSLLNRCRGSRATHPHQRRRPRVLAHGSIGSDRHARRIQRPARDRDVCVCSLRHGMSAD